MLVDYRLLPNGGEARSTKTVQKHKSEIPDTIHQDHPWQHHRPMILTRPHVDHAINADHKLTALANITAATTAENRELFDFKRTVLSYL